MSYGGRWRWGCADKGGWAGRESVEEECGRRVKGTGGGRITNLEFVGKGQQCVDTAKFQISLICFFFTNTFIFFLYFTEK